MEIEKKFEKGSDPGRSRGLTGEPLFDVERENPLGV